MPPIATKAYTLRELHDQCAQRVAALSGTPVYQLQAAAQDVLRRLVAVNLGIIEAIERIDRERRP